MHVIERRHGVAGLSACHSLATLDILSLRNAGGEGGRGETEEGFTNTLV